jgi:xylan 1,4-beta-xylosidase
MKMSRLYQNPILPGFHPDPSICRVGEDYFLVNSSFAYFPGVPVFHSRDLVHWRQIGVCLNRSEQLHLRGRGVSGGIFAPSIRYHSGVFYMVTTNISGGGNFFVTTRDPFGPWSDPVWVKQAGIDPSLLFDDGHVYLTSTGMMADSEQKGQGILQSEIDITTGKMLTKPRLIWTGTGGSYPEGPHLYRIKEKYYLMIAEGGTEYGHTEVIARSDSPWGPWEGCPHNPILTHRSTSSPIQALGHADLVEASDGSWWAVCLGVRPVFPQAQHLGRETFLAPVVWDEDGWPHVGREGRIELEMEAPRLPPVLWDSPAERDHFDAIHLGMKWNFLGVPAPESWSLTRQLGTLSLQGNANRLDDGVGVTWVGRRQEHFNCDVSTYLDFSPEVDGEEAGLTTWKDARHHYDLFLSKENGKLFVGLRRRIGSLAALVAQQEIVGGPVTLRVRANRLLYSFAFQAEDGSEYSLSIGETRYLSSEVAGGFTGVYFAMYATGNGRNCSGPAYFDWFDYRVTEQRDILSVDSTISQLLRENKTREVLTRHIPELVAHLPAEWGANLSLLDLSAMSPEEISPEKLPGIDADLRNVRVPISGS